MRLYNAQLRRKPAPPVELPEADAGLPDDYARTLFGLSSELTPKLMEPEAPAASCTPTLTQGRPVSAAKVPSGFMN